MPPGLVPAHPVFAPAVADELIRHAEAAWPQECCGALLGEGERVVASLRLANAAPDPRGAFAISARDYLAAEARAAAGGLSLLGFYHSHPSGPGAPSLADVAAAGANLLTVIVDASGGSVAGVRAWRSFA